MRRLKSAVFQGCTALTLVLPMTMASSTAAADPPTMGGEPVNPAPTPKPQMKAVLDKLAELNGKPIPQLSAVEARQQPTPADAVKALLTSKANRPSPRR